ncbi:MAG: alcohol dehydrogenase [Muribaculaceae bacterium]|nr:alcohol dehydrogenase [Muribaculaceae bacterium]
MKALTYVSPGTFDITDKPKPVILDPRDAIVKVTLSSICSSDLHILHGSVPTAVQGITVGHEMVGIVESVGPAVNKIKPGDRVAVNVETFCGECFFCRRKWVNNCQDQYGGWALGCTIDGGQTEFARVPYADNGLTPIPEKVSDEQALFVGDILATGYWAAKISEISEEDTVLIIGAGPTGLCTLQCVALSNPRHIVVCEADEARRRFVALHYPNVHTADPCECHETIYRLTENRGADRVIEAAGSETSFRSAWQCARPNAIVTIVALYERPQILPLPEMYGKNLTFKTGGVDGCDCDEIMRLIADGRIDTTHLITHRFPLSRITEAYDLFEKRHDNVVKIAIHAD